MEFKSWGVRALTSSGTKQVRSPAKTPPPSYPSPPIEGRLQGRRRVGSGSEVELITKTTVDMLVDSLFSDAYLQIGTYAPHLPYFMAKVSLYADKSYVDNFLQLYKLFITPKDLLKVLQEMYSVLTPIGHRSIS